jgi:hypothetical protein
MCPGDRTPGLYRIFTYPRFDVSIRMFLLVKASLQSIQRGLANPDRYVTSFETSQMPLVTRRLGVISR